MVGRPSGLRPLSIWELEAASGWYREMGLTSSFSQQWRVVLCVVEYGELPL